MNRDLPAPGGPVVRTWTDRVIRFCLENRLVVFLLLVLLVGWGLYVTPFDLDLGGFPRDPVPVDALPDIGENQQIVFTEWSGRSPQDVEDQITYPLTVALQGVPGVKTIRSTSMFGFSTVYVIFREDIEFYWARTRILERLATAQRSLPDGVATSLGPDATALGQVFWYTLEGKGFDLQELRSIQDWYVRYALQSAEGVSEVASVGGYVKEYQIDVDPDAMRAHGIMLQDVHSAVAKANIDVGAETIDSNGVEYVIRGRGFIQGVADIERILLATTDGVPIYVRNVATVRLGPALRRGVLDVEGSEAVGGVVLVRYGENPMAVIERVRRKIAEIQVGLPEKTLPDGTVSQVRIVPFYDRTGLIRETLGTLEDALVEEVLITCFVVFMLLAHFRSNLLISATLPLAVLMSFVLMKLFGVDSNIMSLGGIAIAIGTMVDMGIILCENIVRHFDEADPEEEPLEVIYRAASEVGGAVVTAISTTLVSFLPIFALTGPEGRLFRPLAYTKTFALFASVFIALTVLPALARILFGRRRIPGGVKSVAYAGLFAIGVAMAARSSLWTGAPLVLLATFLLTERFLPRRLANAAPIVASVLAACFVLVLLTMHWMPLGFEASLPRNLIFVFGVNLAWTALRVMVVRAYEPALRVILRHKALFLAAPATVVVLGLAVWLGFSNVAGWVPRLAERAGVSGDMIRSATLWVAADHALPGLGREFMPPLDEGSFLFMPSTMPHASIGEARDILGKQDRAIRAIPEVDAVVGKAGRAETAIDPAPVSMIETVVTYVPEYGPPDPETGTRPRQWRDSIRTPDDIWAEIVRAADVPGSTSAPKLQPIAARIVMLQSGMRAPMGIKVRGQNLAEIERAGRDISHWLRQVRGVNAEAVIPDRVVAKPYLEITIDRERIARYRVNIRDVQDVIEIAIGGVRATSTVEGRERYPVRVRYPRELRDTAEAIAKIVVPSTEGLQIPLAQLATIDHTVGPQEIKSEDTFLVSYVLFDKRDGFAEVDVVEDARRLLDEKIANGELVLPSGTHYSFAGSYENQVRFQERLAILLPVSLLLIFLIIYLQFRSTPLTFLVFVQISVTWAGGFIGLWLAAQPWFLDFQVAGHGVRELLHLREYHLSVAVWVGFIALFGIATDDQVVVATYLQQLFAVRPIASVDDIRRLVIEGAMKRIRPCLMTTATTVLALLPVLTSSGRGADVMIPMALPLVGGMTVDILTLFIMPVLYSWLKELQWRRGWRKGNFVPGDGCVG